MSIFNKTYKAQYYGFLAFIVVNYITYILAALGVASISPKYIQTLDFYVKIYISLFLIIRFNGFAGKIEFTDLDRKIAFNAGFFLLTTTGINNVLKWWMEKEKISIPPLS